MKILKILGSVFGLVVVGGLAFLTLSSGLKSDPNVGLSPTTHAFGDVDVRDFTDAPLGAEVKVFLPISPREAVELAYGYEEYPDWVVPAPEKVTADNSDAIGGEFGVGSKVSYSPTETDVIEYLDPNVAMIARPLWGLENFEGHRGVVIVTPAEGGSIMHMRRYFETSSVPGWFMSKMMPIMMEASADNLAEKFGGQVY